MNSKIKTHTATQLDQSYRLMQPGSNCYLPHRSETVLHPSPLFHQCRTWSEHEFERSEVSSWAPYSLIRVIDHWPRWLLPPYYLLSSPNVLLTVPSLKPTPAGKNVQCRQRRMDNNRAASHFHWFFFFFFPQLLLVSSDVSRHIDCIVCGSICVYVLPLFLDISV